MSRKECRCSERSPITRHLILLTFVLTLSCHIHNANSQPLLNQLAVLLRARPPWPTSFPTAASQNQQNQQQNQNQNNQNNFNNNNQNNQNNFNNNNQNNQNNFNNNQNQNNFNNNNQNQNQQQQQSQIVSVQQPQNVQMYASSSEQMQNFIQSNNIPLSQGIPVVAVDPQQNSITIVQPTGPETITGPGNGNVFVAQQFNQSGNQQHATSYQNTGPMVQVIPNLIGLDTQNLLDTNLLNQPQQQSGPANNIQQFPAGFMLNQNKQGPPPPPPIPKNLKGPAIIAVPKVPPQGQQQQQNLQQPQNIQTQNLLPPGGNFLSNFQRFLPHHAVNPGNPQPQLRQPTPVLRGQPILQNQHRPVIIQQFQHPQLPAIAAGFRPFIPLDSQDPNLITLPENAIYELNKTMSQNDQELLHPLIQFHKEVVNQPEPPPPTSLELQHAISPQRSTTTSSSQASELSPDYVGPPKYQRKRQFKKPYRKQKFEESSYDSDDSSERKPIAVLVQFQHSSNRGNILNKFKATPRPTQIPLPGEPDQGASASAHQQFESRQSSTPIYGTSPLSDYSLSTIINMPSTTITGSFEYPDPPTPPNYQSMNKLKYPSPYEDSAEVVVKNIISKPRLRENRLNLSPFIELKKRVRSSSTHTPDASNLYRQITTASALPSTSAFDIETDFRDTTTFNPASIQSRDILSRIRNPPKTEKSFRPSPQIHSFEEPVTGVRSYITILPPRASEESIENKSDRNKKSLGGKASESKLLHFEQGFKPVNHFVNNFGSGTIPPPSTTTETLYFDLIREVVSKKPWESDDRITVTSPSNHPYVTMGNSHSLEESFIKAGWKVRQGESDKRQVTTDSSERVEDWRHPEGEVQPTSSKIYFGNGKFGPPNCDKFHRFGFCPMNSGYPTEQVEKIAGRCSALLSHLIAPLPKADVRYDVIVAKNGSMLKGKSQAPSGWSWKSFSGKPVCDTKEIKVVPGWAKNEQGEWLVILQTKAWKQEAQITLCTPQGTTYNTCEGSTDKNCTPIKIKCVQRFTAQRLAVLDPENTDRCPVLRSVFLPSACVCLNDNSSERKGKELSSEELSRAHSRSRKGKGKGRKSSYNKKSSRRKEEENSSVASVSKSEEKKDDIDTAADMSTSGSKMKMMRAHMRPETEETQEDEENDVETEAETKPHAEPLNQEVNTSQKDDEPKTTEDQVEGEITTKSPEADDKSESESADEEMPRMYL